MVTTAFWVFGYWRTARLVSERTPSTRIKRLMVIASTGLRMKRSVKFIYADSLFLRLRIGTVRWLHLVVDDQRRAALELDLAAGHHLGAGLDAFQDSYLIAARRAGGDEYLLREQARVALFVLVFLLVGRLHHEYRVAVGIEGDCGLGKRDIAALLARVHPHIGEHPGKQLSLGIGDRGLDLHVAGVGIDLGVDRIDLPGEANALVGVRRQCHRLADRDLRQLLLRQIEVHVNGIDGL